MATFVQQEELPQQRAFKEWKGTDYSGFMGGVRKVGAAWGGVDVRTGKKKGGLLGHGNVFHDQYLGEMFMKDGSAADVHKSGRADAWQKQMASFEAAKSIMSLVGGGGAGGMMGGDSGMASMFGQGTGGAAGQGTVAGNTMNSFMGGSGGDNSVQNMMGNKMSSFGQNQGTSFAGGGGDYNEEARKISSESDISATDVDDPENYETEEEYIESQALKGSGGVANSKANNEKIQKMTKGATTKDTEEGNWNETKVMEKIPIAGNALSGITKSFQAKQIYKKNKEKKYQSMFGTEKERTSGKTYL